MSDLYVEQVEAGIVFWVKVVPGSSKDSFAGLLEDMVKVKISAPAEKGKANKGLVGFLAKALGVKRNSIKILTGETNPVKKIFAEGVTREGLDEIFGSGA